MGHYVGVFVPMEAGGWRALFPDVPQCSTDAESLDQAIFRAANELARFKEGARQPIPAPRDLTEIKADEAWASACGIDWTQSVVTMIPLRA
jgi:predicted RNase H-like HicB family nuclease